MRVHFRQGMGRKSEGAMEEAARVHFDIFGSYGSDALSCCIFREGVEAAEAAVCEVPSSEEDARSPTAF